ncbi:hypothetical protein IAU60_001983 [Kwoniella sp. DSM 27419]
MLLRRLYSSAPPPRAALSSTTASISSPLPSRPATRGRVKPARLSTIANKAKFAQSAAAIKPTEGKGRRKARTLSTSETTISDSARERIAVDSPRLSLLPFESEQDLHADHSNVSSAPISTGSSASRLTFTHPVPSADHVNTFRPIQLYPEQFKLHTTFTHPSHPLPLNLTTAIYTVPRRSSTTPIIGDIFAAPPPPDPTPALRKVVKGSGLNDHFRVISNLSHPRLSHHLGEHQPLAMGMGELEFGGLAGTLGHKVAEMKEQYDAEWQQILAKLEPRAVEPEHKAEASAQSADANLSEVVGDLTSVLSRLGLSSARGRKAPAAAGAQEVMMADDEVVWMDSVKRKRKKKISKHKYKKRRKDTRALRKRLGK